MLKNYIGLSSTFHDPAISIVNSSGDVVFAEDLERYLQNKRALQCVSDNLYYIRKVINEYCEDGADLVVARTWSKKHLKEMSSIKISITKKLMKYFLPNQINNYLQFIMESNKTSTSMTGKNIPMAIYNTDFSQLTSKKTPKIQIIDKYYNHHLTHAANACYSSSFKDAACLVVDGAGEESSVSYYQYKDGVISRIGKQKKIMKFFNSLGVFYGLLSDACGFESLIGEEWKLMGLAPYGKYDPEIYEWLRPIMYVKDNQLYQSKDCMKIATRLAKIARKQGESIHDVKNLAFTGHKIFCDIFLELIESMHNLFPSENLVVTGGCALNSAWMGKILEQSKFNNLFVPSAPADNGNAIGAALLAYKEDHPGTVFSKEIQSPYLGSKMEREKIKNLKTYGGLKNSLQVGKPIHERAAELLAEGKIVGWIQGRSEFGPRALGNRSILADPRTKEVKDILNTRVKFREEFRPFAPSILHEYGDQYFENYQESPYMDRALKFREEVKHLVSGVVHVDGTGRLQTVKKEWNERYYNLIKSFMSITGIPIVLNTSFNVMGKPIIHSVEDSIAVFFTSGLDVLVINDELFEKDKQFNTDKAFKVSGTC
jgi:carbamoyltransferase